MGTMGFFEILADTIELSDPRVDRGNNHCLKEMFPGNVGHDNNGAIQFANGNRMCTKCCRSFWIALKPLRDERIGQAGTTMGHPVYKRKSNLYEMLSFILDGPDRIPERSLLWRNRGALFDASSS